MVAVLEIGALSTFSTCLTTTIEHSTPILIVTSILAGRLGDAVGRRQTLFIGATIFVLGGAIQTAATGFNSMVVGRLISGAGVGLLSYVLHCRSAILHSMIKTALLSPFIKAKYLPLVMFVSVKQKGMVVLLMPVV